MTLQNSWRSCQRSPLWFLLGLIVLVAATHPVAAQLTISGILLSDGQACQSYGPRTLQIQDTGGTPLNPSATYTWEILAVPGSLLPAAVGLSAAKDPADGRRFIVSGVPNRGGVVRFRLRVTCSAGAGGCHAGFPFTGPTIYTINVTKRPSVILVLDASGSMSENSCPSGCVSKMQTLKDAVTLFYQRYLLYASSSGMSVTNDRTAMVAFATALNTSMGTLVPLSTGSSTIPAFINGSGFNASGATAMGGGMQEAINRLQASGCGEKHVIVFTDGMQNMNPMVSTDGGTIANDPSRFPAGGVIPGPYSNLNPALGIKIHTIGIGGSASDGHFQLLGQIANNTGALTLTTPVLDASAGSVGGMNLGDFYQNTLLQVLKGNTPGLITRRNKRLTSDANVETFDVNKKVKRLVIELVYERNREMSFSVEKDGIEIPTLRRIINGEFYKFLVLDFPFQLRDSTVNSEGSWKITVRGNTGSAYKLAAIADDHNLQYSTHSEQSNGKAGEPLDLDVNLFYRDVPIDSNTTVRAIISGPNDKSLGTLLSTYNARKKITSPISSSRGIVRATANVGGDSLNAAQVKYRELINDPEFYNALLPASRTITLENTGNGRYSGKYTQTDIPGTYTVQFLIDGTVDSIGHIVREEARSSVVGFGKPRQAISDLRFFPGANPYITFRPRDTYRNYLGPDNAQLISVRVEGQPVNRFRDELNGTYTYFFDNLPNGSRSDVSVSVDGDDLFSGKLSAINKNWGLTLNAGIAIPTQEFDRAYNPGPMGELHLTRYLSPTFSISAAGGYYAFDEDYSIFGASAYLSLHVPKFYSSLSLSASAGGGYYKPESVEATAGLSARAGVSKSLSNTTFFKLEGAYFKMQDYDLEFFTAQIGFSFLF